MSECLTSDLFPITRSLGFPLSDLFINFNNTVASAIIKAGWRSFCIIVRNFLSYTLMLLNSYLVSTLYDFTSTHTV